MPIIDPNTYIHGTTSTALALLSKTDFQLMPILKMLDDHARAPMTGELTLGGYDTIGFELAQNSMKGAISFGRINGCSYNIDSITQGYTKFPAASANHSLERFNGSLDAGPRCAFANLNLLLIYFVRVRQTHPSLDGIISRKKLDEVIQKLEAVAQFYCFLQLLGKSIFPDIATLREQQAIRGEDKRDIMDAVFTYLTFEAIVNKIMVLQLDLEKILQHPSEDKLASVLTLLELKEKGTIESRCLGNKKDVTFAKTQFFTTHRNSLEWKGALDDPKYFFYTMSQNCSGYRVTDLFESVLKQRCDDEFLQEFHEDCKKQFVAINDRIRIFKKLIAAPQKTFQLPEDEVIYNEPFPIVFLTNSTDMEPIGREHRSLRPLKLGVDIQIIATDTRDHQQKLFDYLSKHGLNAVEIVLIEDLKKLKSAYAPMDICAYRAKNNENGQSSPGTQNFNAKQASFLYRLLVSLLNSIISALKYVITACSNLLYPKSAVPSM
jgi:hypothetical protein